MVLNYLQPDAPPYETIPVIAGLSLIGCVVGTLTTPPIEEETQEDFVKTARVGGFWKEVKARLGEDFIRSVAREHANDIKAVALALPAQLCFFFACMCFIVHDWAKFAASGSVVLVCSVGLYFFWYRHLPEAKEP